MLSWLLNLINPLNSIISAISNTKIAQINATSDVEKAQLSAQLGVLETKRDVLIAEASSKSGWIDTSIRALLALPPAIYFAKIFIWDKVIGSWPSYRTDGLNINDAYVVMAVLGFYFLYSTARLFR